MTKHILVTKEKGGVAATTTAVNLGYDLAQRGHSVVIVDMDTRGDCAPCLGMDTGTGLVQALNEGRHLEGNASLWGMSQITQWKDLYLFETNTASTHEALAMATSMDMDELIELLERLSICCDYVIYDTSAASGRLRQAAMQMADLMIVPTHAEALGMADIGELIEVYGRPLQVIVLPVSYDMRLGIHEYNLGVLQDAYGEQVAGPIPHRVAVIESHSAMAPLLVYEPENDASYAYRNLTDDVLAALENPTVEALEADNPYLLSGEELDRAEAVAKTGR